MSQDVDHLLRGRLEVLKLDGDALGREFPEIFARIKTNCPLCGDRQTCVMDLQNDPSACGLKPDYIPSAVLAVGARVYPTRGLALHEWREHGTCTGLDAAYYFRAVQYARDEFTLPEKFAAPHERFTMAPDEIVKAFAAVNANLTADSMAVTCERGELIDVRFCLTRDLRAFARCPKVARRSCRDDSVGVSPVR